MSEEVLKNYLRMASTYSVPPVIKRSEWELWV
jgi:hypothetical protein